MGQIHRCTILQSKDAHANDTQRCCEPLMPIYLLRYPNWRTMPLGALTASNCVPCAVGLSDLQRDG